MKLGRLTQEAKLELTLFSICAALTVLLYFVAGHKMVVLNLFYLPVVLAAFYLGRHRAGILALVCVLFASVVAVLDLESFASTTSPLVIGLALTVWAAVMGLNAIFVGTLSDERTSKISELHDAYIGVVEVLSRYLNSANPVMKDRSKRICALSQQVARRMRLAEKEIDDIRIAALLKDIDNIEVTAKVIHRAVGDLQRDDSNEHTFHGSDLVHSLGSVLTGALPLIVQENSLQSGFDLDDEEEPNNTSKPFGAHIIQTVTEYDTLIHTDGTTSPDEAISVLRSDLDGTHHPAVVHALEEVVLRTPVDMSDKLRSLETLVRFNS